MSPFDFKQDYVLENDYVLLRPLLKSDLEHLQIFSITEPEIWKFSLVQANGKENLEKYVESALEERDKQRQYTFIVFDKIHGVYCGSTRFCDIQLATQCLQVGYTWYGKHFQGTKLNKNCKLLLLQFAFEVMQMERIEFRVDALNNRGIAALIGIGCTIEGRLRKNGPALEAGRRDSFVLSILKEEWETSVKTNLHFKLHQGKVSETSQIQHTYEIEPENVRRN